MVDLNETGKHCLDVMKASCKGGFDDQMALDYLVQEAAVGPLRCFYCADGEKDSGVDDCGKELAYTIVCLLACAAIEGCDIEQEVQKAAADAKKTLRYVIRYVRSWQKYLEEEEQL